MKNRYGNEYEFVQVSDNVYTITGDLEYWRYGGRESGERVDLSNLGFADPSGGPFIAPGFLIAGRPVTRIRVVDDQLLLEVE
jgi:hypothetical protein